MITGNRSYFPVLYHEYAVVYYRAFSHPCVLYLYLILTMFMHMKDVLFIPSLYRFKAQ